MLAELTRETENYLKSLGAPITVLQNTTHLYSFIILILPYSTGKLKQSLKKLPTISAKFPQLQESFSSIYRENNRRQRINFFKNKLIKFLWQHYIHCNEA